MARYSRAFAHIGREKRAAYVARKRQENTRMEPQHYEDLVRRLVSITVHQDHINDDLRACVQEQREFNRQQVEINQRLTAAIERLDVTQARIEVLLSRMLGQGDNGQEA